LAQSLLDHPNCIVAPTHALQHGRNPYFTDKRFIVE